MTLHIYIDRQRSWSHLLKFKSVHRQICKNLTNGSGNFGNFGNSRPLPTYIPDDLATRANDGEELQIIYGKMLPHVDDRNPYIFLCFRYTLILKCTFL